MKPYGRNKKIFGRSIDERPVEVLKRLEMGHWELDIVEGKKGKKKACLLTFLERSSRFLIVRKIANKNHPNLKKIFLSAVYSGAIAQPRRKECTAPIASTPTRA